MSKRKFIPGRKITSIAVLVKELETTGFVYWGPKIMHVGWMQSQHLRTLMNTTKGGGFRKAVRL